MDANGFPTWHMPKANMTVAGRKAVETRTRGGWCATLRGTETITVMIPRAASGNWYQMDACLRSPGLTRQEAEISSMLKSVHISSSSEALQAAFGRGAMSPAPLPTMYFV